MTIQPKPRFSPNFSARNRRNLLGGGFGLLSATLLISWGCGTAAPEPTFSTGGTAAATGGAPAATGGAPAATGGTPAATGGTPAATGGTPSTGGTSSTGGTPAVPDCVTAAMATKCVAACHSTQTAPFFGGLDLSGDFLPRLLDKPATYMGVLADDMPKCVAGAKLIDSANPAESVLLKKLNGTQACGTVMPQVGTLTADEKTCLLNWIQTF